MCSQCTLYSLLQSTWDDFHLTTLHEHSILYVLTLVELLELSGREVDTRWFPEPPAEPTEGVNKFSDMSENPVSDIDEKVSFLKTFKKQSLFLADPPPSTGSAPSPASSF